MKKSNQLWSTAQSDLEGEQGLRVSLRTQRPVQLILRFPKWQQPCKSRGQASFAVLPLAVPEFLILN
ncbi:hypothetical protein I7I48_00602 [Histoplasma ohiense]|nr:hypothetical protein I7I48_00602 [Histoplasma ohiense (nom. inval.)]